MNYEDSAEWNYQPYRVVDLPNKISIMKGEDALVVEIRYFSTSPHPLRSHRQRVVFCANERYDQEKVSEQLKKKKST